ncbi:MAG: NUDIX domain-containing protein [Ignavibacteria bacterium]|nr:NUDIX domain-containing protein [Ignavibacteria bacterium]
MNVVIHISTVITDGSKVLMVKEGKKVNYGLYNFPGGHLEVNENILKAAYREIIEETSVEAKIDYLINILVTKGETTYINFIFHADYISGEAKPQQGEILECRWIEIDDLINGFDGELLNKEKKIKVLKDYLAGKRTELDVLVNF